MFQDFLFYAADVKTQYAFRLVHLSRLVSDAAQKHELVGVRAELLGDVLVNGVLLSSILETEERVNLRIQMGSDFTVASETTCNAEVRGYLQSADDSEFLKNLENGVHTKQPVVVRSLRSVPNKTKLNEGITQSQFGSVSQVVNEHLETSFQSNARVRSECWTDAEGQLRAFGVIYLELPNLPQTVETELAEHVAQIKRFSEMDSAVLEDPDLLSKALAPHEIRAVNSVNPRWQCTCSVAGIEGMLLRLSSADLAEMADTNEPAKVTCHYCNTQFEIPVKRLRELSFSKQANEEAPAKPSADLTN